MTRPLVFAFASALSFASAQKVNEHAAIVQDFEKRIGEYHKLRTQVEGKLPALKPTRSQAEIVEHEKAMAIAIREARGSASRGDIFTPEIAGEFRRLIALATQGAAKPRVKKSLERAEPVEAPFKVNDSYPARVPLQSTPPTLLLNLPELPPDVDYRIVGHSLILRDAKANLIVDYVPAIIP